MIRADLTTRFSFLLLVVAASPMTVACMCPGLCEDGDLEDANATQPLQSIIFSQSMRCGPHSVDPPLAPPYPQTPTWILRSFHAFVKRFSCVVLDWPPPPTVTDRHALIHHQQ